jgi:hypothetical protein
MMGDCSSGTFSDVFVVESDVESSGYCLFFSSSPKKEFFSESRPRSSSDGRSISGLAMAAADI